jgi:hypothetical protein
MTLSMVRALLALPARFTFLMAAILIYALFGSPTPDHPGWVEFIIGVLLVLAAGNGFINAFKLSGEFLPLRIFFLFGLSVPVITGLAHGYDMVFIARDGAAFLFLCLPLFLADMIGKTTQRLNIMLAGIVLLGLIFSLRALAPAYGYAAPSGELYYLTNAPTVLFAAIFMAGFALRHLSSPLTARAAVTAGCAGLIVVTIIWAMLLDVQRATIFAVVVSMAFFTGVVFVRAPRRVVVPMLLIGVLAACIYPVVLEAVHAMAHKTAQVGLNMRIEEFRTVMETITGSVWTTLFGMGWGVKMASPAVGGVAVAFTHSLLSYLLLKMGLCGVGLGLVWITVCLKKIRVIARYDIVLATGLLWGMLIPVFLYASHKSLDFGLILLMITVLADGFHARLARPNAPV